MISSQEFRTRNQILFSAPILTNVEVKKDFSAGWGEPCSTGQVDVFDLNSNGKADQPEKQDDYSREAPKRVSLTEPALYAPRFSALAACAQAKGSEVLTAADIPCGVYVSNPQAEQVSDSVVEKSQQSIRSIDTLVAERFDPQHPEARWAIDVAKQEFLLFVPQ